jgi:hypothetical protein
MPCQAARRAARSLVCVLFVAFLTACGGGGGGGSDGITIRFSTSSVNFAGIEGTPIAPQVVVANASGSTDQTIYVGAEVLQGTALQLPITFTVDAAARSAQIALQPRTDLAAGTHTGRVRLLACADELCNRHHSGSPFDVNYSIVVAPRLGFPNDTAVALAVAETTVGTDRAVNVQLPAPGTVLATQVAYSNGNGWLNVQQSGAGLVLRASAVGLVPGTYAAQVQVQGGQPLQQATLPVTLTVSSGLVVPATADVTLATASPPSTLVGAIVVGLAPGVADGRWQATSSKPWLELTVASGTAADPSTNSIGYLLDRNAVAALANGQTHTAYITVTSPAGLLGQSIAFRMHKDLAEAVSVDVLALRPDQAGELLVYGRFAEADDPAAYLRIAGAAPLSVERLGAGLLKVQMPAMPIGTYTLTMANDAAVPTRAHDVKVLAAQDYAYASVDTQGDKGPLLWDPQTRSLLTMNRDLSSLMRFAFVGGTQWTPTAYSVPGLLNLGMTVDRGRLLSLSAPNWAVLHDPVTLQPTGLFTLAGEPYGHAPPQIPLTITGDNRLWTGGGMGFGLLGTLDLDTGEQRTLPGRFDFYSGPWGTVSRNGRRLLMTQSLSISPAPPMLAVDLADSIISTVPPTGFNGFARVSQSRDGSRTALESIAVFDAAWNRMGNITLPARWIGLRTMLSRDGSRAYVYALHEDAVGTYSEPDPIVFRPRIYVLDTSTTLTTLVDFPILGSFDLADDPSCRVTQPTGPACSPYGVQTVLSDDDRTVFAIGDRKLVVVPVPGGLRPASASVLRQRSLSGGAALKRLQ